MADILLLIIRWLHAIAAVAWVGGAIFYWLILRPALRSGDPSGLITRFAGPEFGQVVSLAVGILIITGAILSFDRLSAETVTAAYVSVLVVKILLAGWMFALVWTRRQDTSVLSPAPSGWLRTAIGSLTNINATLVLGPVVFFLSDLLRFLVERELSG